MRAVDAPAQGSHRAYRVLCGGVGGLLVLGGLALFSLFFRYHTASYRGASPDLPLPLDGWGVYMAAMAGCAMLGWGGGLLAGVRHPVRARTAGTATALALVAMALYRLFAWMIGDYPQVATALRAEAAVFLVLALAFVWLRPRRERAAAAPGRAPLPASGASGAPGEGI